jgi:hypothetical protein
MKFLLIGMEIEVHCKGLHEIRHKQKKCSPLLYNGEVVRGTTDKGASMPEAVCWLCGIQVCAAD